ncbi:MAG TPA: PSD1 and planctomycete cytochrome C domain-containing protein [Planctomycetaceae bacterium]|nr:PSD1 and planctomycete cytochrome C domain-containing protein [Planctomycetaceae bacterium]
MFDRRSHFAFLCGIVGILSLGNQISLGQITPATPEDTINFEKEVLPIFKQNCFECHGEKNRESGLRFFGEADLVELNDSGLAAVKPKHSDESELIRRVLSNDDSERMPPEGDPLTPQQIETLKAWIDAGAVWPEEFTIRAAHWAYVLPKRPERPQVKQSEWCRNEIDYFVLKRLEDAGMSPSPEAAPEILLRRVYLDLIGIPPTVEQIDSYLRDSSPDRYEKVVDQLLKSPLYGEKWARQWLDLARYADSNGYQADQYREIWSYRDWVIEAMNDDMPFDQFTVEQIAGDLLPEATLDQKIATGFQRCTTCNVEAGVDPEENRVNQIVDRVNTLGTVWLGTSLECAQCHNHKYDPFTMKDYYSLFAFFNNTPLEVVLPDNKGVQYEVAGPQMPLPLSPELQTKKDALEAQKSELELKRSIRTKELLTKCLEFERKLTESLSSAPEWHVLDIVALTADGNPDMKVLDDKSVLLSGPNPEKTTYRIEVVTKIPRITGFKLETLTHESLPGNGPGRGDAQRPNFVLYEFGIEQIDPQTPEMRTPISLNAGTADFSQKNWDVNGLIDGKPDTGWAINPQFGKDHWATFPTKQPVNPDGNEIRLVFTLPQHFGSSRTIGRIRLSAMTGDPKSESIPENVRELLASDSAKRNEKQLEALAKYQRESDPTWVELNGKIETLQKQIDGIKPPTTLVMVEMDKPRPTNIMKRGNFLDPGASVAPAVPEALHSLSAEASSNRLDLANWIVSPDNPLVRRVVVNRWWAEFFGAGIVRTPEDFGQQGETPTHPLLLDLLAEEFLRTGWSRKQVHRMIVTSAAYRQSSRISKAQLEADPYNKLLGRQTRVRLSAEAIRDNALTISGLLSEGRGGPPIYPPQPDNIWRHVGRNAPKFDTSTDEKRYRRGIYVVWRRSAPYPSFVNFDAPDRASCVVNRSRTNTPLQALTLLNDPAFVEMSQGFAERILAESPSADPELQLQYAFRSCTARQPSERELQILSRLYTGERERLKETPQATRELVPDKTLSEDERLERAVWFSLGNILLNLDETITKN